MQYSENLTIKHWAEEDRPREKLILKGKAALSDAELIAILIGSGTRDMSAVELAKKILSKYQNDLNLVAKLSINDLKKFHGIGEAKAISIISALEIGRRRKDALTPKKNKIISAESAYEYLKPMLMDLDHEQFWVIYLNRSNEVLRKEMISQGGVAGTVVDTKIIFKKALEELATYILLAHNHPSGNNFPSEQDKLLTRRIKEGGRLLDISVIDHIIFTNDGFYSFADESDL